MLRRYKPRLAAGALITIGIAGLLLVWLVNGRQPVAPIPKSVDVTASPSSVRPSRAAIAGYQVAPASPKYIAIPAIGIANTRIIHLGLLKNGQIATPDNIYDTGWYRGSAEPGKPGAMFVYGHVSSWTANGVFHDLKKLKPGDTITITRGDDTIFQYQVTGSKIYAASDVDMKALLTPVNPNQSVLNLMTCTGKIIKGTSEFNEKLVVFTGLVRKAE